MQMSVLFIGRTQAFNIKILQIKFKHFSCWNFVFNWQNSVESPKPNQKQLRNEITKISLLQTSWKMYMNMFRRVSLTGLLIMIMLMKQVPSLVEYLVPCIISRLHLKFSKFAITMFPGSLMTPNKCNQLGNCSEKHEAYKRLRNRINAKLERD